MRVPLPLRKYCDKRGRHARVAVLALCLLLCAGTFGFGQEAGPCDRDIERFCQDVQVYGGWTAKCLEQHMDELTPDCKVRVTGLAYQAEEAGLESCESDIRDFCLGVKPGGGRIAECLAANQPHLSAGCRITIEEARPGWNEDRTD